VDAYTSLSSLLVGQKRWRAAAFTSLLLLRVEPQNTASRARLAQCLEELKDEAAAREQRSIAQQLQRSDAAESALIDSRDREPRNLQTRLALAKRFEESGKFSQSFRRRRRWEAREKNPSGNSSIG
jgi:hypothetical protein